MDAAGDQLLIAQAFQKDPLVLEARNTILAALERHQQQITGVKAADRALVKSYAETVAAFSEVRGGELYFPYLAFGRGCQKR